jgi:hypothetical protein
VATENVVHKSAQITARPDFDKHPHPGLVHGLNGLTEAHRAGPLLDGQAAYVGCILGVWLRRRTRVHLYLRGSERQALKKGLQLLAKRLK